MNRYLIIHRLRWPALLLLTGVIALLDEENLLSWGRAWPLYLILLGVLTLAERATIGSQPPIPPAAYPYAGSYPGQGYPAPGYTAPGYTAAGYQDPNYAAAGYSNPAYPSSANPNSAYAAQQPGYPPQAVRTSPAAPTASTGTAIVPASDAHGLTTTNLGINREEEER